MSIPSYDKLFKQHEELTTTFSTFTSTSFKTPPEQSAAHDELKSKVHALYQSFIEATKELVQETEEISDLDSKIRTLKAKICRFNLVETSSDSTDAKSPSPPLRRSPDLGELLQKLTLQSTPTGEKPEAVEETQAPLKKARLDPKEANEDKSKFQPFGTTQLFHPGKADPLKKKVGGIIPRSKCF